MVSASEITTSLNKLFDIDPCAASALISHRVECSEAFIADDVTFVCGRSEDGTIQMGVVGFLNGTIDPCSGRVAAVYEEGQLSGFTVLGADGAHSSK